MEYLSTAQIVGLGLMAVFVLLGSALIGRRARAATPRSEVLIKRTRPVGTFDTRDSRNGLVQLVIYQEYLDAGTKDDPAAERKGRRRLMTKDGRIVDKIRRPSVKAGAGS